MVRCPQKLEGTEVWSMNHFPKHNKPLKNMVLFAGHVDQQVSSYQDYYTRKRECYKNNQHRTKQEFITWYGYFNTTMFNEREPVAFPSRLSTLTQNSDRYL